MLPFKCEHCDADQLQRDAIEKETGQPLCDPSLRDQWGCEEPTQIPVWEDEDEGELFFNCPVRFISEAVVLWYDEHAYFETYQGTAPQYTHMPAKFIEAVTIYKKHMMVNFKRKNKRGDKNSDGLSFIRQAHNGR